MNSNDYTILYRDPVLVAVNKPAGMPTQADRSGDLSLDQLLTREFGVSIFVVHRLDRPASGIVVFALTKRIAGSLSQMLRDHRMKRIYWAIVSRPPEQADATLAQRITFDPRKNRSSVTDRGGKSAVLSYRTIAKSHRYTLLEVQLETGRHHQIRAQLSSIGCPIRGDLKYGAARSQRGGGIGLHAAGVAFSHPDSSARLVLSAPPPEDTLWKALTAALPVSGEHSSN